MTGDTHFQRYIPEPYPEELVPADEMKRHILCSGK
jgi:2-oxoglutarate dehydrogenase E1 component